MNDDGVASAAPSGPSRGRRRLDDAKAMRALAHPVRVALCEALMMHGAMTATQAAEHLGESPSNLSFHFRQLAKYGFVEEADDVTIPGRSRPWRLTSVGSSTASAGQDEDLRDAVEALGDVVIERAVQRHRRWVSQPSAELTSWDDILGVSQTVWWLTQQEADDLRADLGSLVDRYMDRLADPTQRPTDARPVEFLALLHPLDEGLDQS